MSNLLLAQMEDLVALPMCAPEDCDCPLPNVMPGDLVHKNIGGGTGCLCSCGRVISFPITSLAYKQIKQEF